MLFLITAGLLSALVPYFLTPANLLGVLTDQAALGVLAVGMTLVILTGGIDLSVGSAVALSGMLMGLVWERTHSGPLALATALAVGAGCGAVNGLLISRGNVPPLIVTLATLSVYRGAAYAMGSAAGVGGFPPEVLAWNRGSLGPIPVPICLEALLMLGAAIYLARTDGGRAVYAVGANSAAARLSGVPVGSLLLRVYLFNGLMAGLAAILYAARNSSVKPDIGAEYELLAITMVVLGGTSVSGGEGSVAGTALGFLTLIFIQRGITLKGLPGELHGVVVAALLIGALLLDAGFRRRAQASSASA